MTREAGFTLTELMVTLTIVAILMGIGVPSYKYVTNADRVSSEINGLLGDLMFARAEAIREGQPVTVCPSSDGASCLASGATWNTGWIVWADLNGDGTLSPVDATTNEILRVQPGFKSTDTMTSAITPDAVVFNREGFSPTLGGPTQFTLKDAKANPNYTRCLTLQVTGLMATATNKSDPTNCN
jgi:type IV fimbrial biogenesis protein FimT